jgi:hypothetical protein
VQRYVLYTVKTNLFGFDNQRIMFWSEDGRMEDGRYQGKEVNILHKNFLLPTSIFHLYFKKSTNCFTAKPRWLITDFSSKVNSAKVLEYPSAINIGS